MWLTGGKRHAQGLARSQQVLLADHFIVGMRAEALCQRQVGGRVREERSRSVHAGIVAETALAPDPPR